MTGFYDFLFYFFAGVAGLILSGALAILLGYLLQQGVPVLGTELIFGTSDLAEITNLVFLRQVVLSGLWPAMVGTCLLVFVALVTALPLGLAAGIYLAEYASSFTRSLFLLAFDLLAGVPSIVIGLFGFSLTLYLHKYVTDFTPCLLISGFSLALLVLPYIVRTTQTALEDLPASLRLTAAALGVHKAAMLTSVLLPQALPGIFSGIVLAIGRAAEDTAVIMLTGVVATAGIPGSLFDSYEALPFFIYYTASQFGSQHELQQGFGAALILLLISLMLFTGAGIIRKKTTQHLLFKRR